MLLNDRDISCFLDTVSRDATEVCEEFYNSPSTVKRPIGLVEETATRVGITVGMNSTRSHATKTTDPEIEPAKALHGSGCA